MGDPANLNEFVDFEYNRLTDKKKTVDDAVSGQKRAIILNESYRKRFARYTQIIMTICAVLLIYLGVLVLRKMVPVFPVWITDLFLAVVFFIGTIYCISVFREIMMRSVLNYDELDLPPYTESTPTV
jgi:hypothetical protein